MDKLFGIFLLSLIFVCCTNTPKTINDEEIPRQVVDSASTMVVDTIFSADKYVQADAFFVYEDSILVILNKRATNTFLLEFRDLVTGNLIRKCFRYGNGPDEMLSIIASLNGNILTVNDYVKKQVAIIDMDSVKGKAYKVHPLQHRTSSPFAVWYKENFVLENPYCFREKESKFYQEAPRFIVTNGKEMYKEQEKYKYYTWNVSCSGQIIVDSSKNRVVYASFLQPVIEIYDDKLTLLKSLRGPVEQATKYVVDEEEGLSEVLVKGEIPYNYLGYCTDTSSFYVTYSGAMDENGEVEKYPVYILQFDWDGNLKKCMSVGRYVSNISKSQEKSTFYGTALNKDNNPFLIKMKNANE